MNRMAIAALALLSAIPAAAQQQPRFGESVDVNVVLIDAVVTDKKDNQILGLGKEDFVVKENGVVQTIDSVDYITSRHLLTGREENAPFKVDRVRNERYFIFFFDKPSDGQLWNDITRARNAARDFVAKKMREGDKVAIAGHDVRLKVYSDFTSDKKQLNAALDEVGKFSRGVDSGEGAIMKTMNAGELIAGTGTVYEALETLANATRSIAARKNLIIFSPGIHEPGQVIQNGMIVTQSRFYEPMIRALNSANVTAYAVNLVAAGVVNDVPAIHQTLDQIAAETGGQYTRTTVTFDSFLDRVEKANSGYYLITYRSPHERGTSGFQRVQVSVKNKGLRLKARTGYTFGS